MSSTSLNMPTTAENLQVAVESTFGTAASTAAVRAVMGSIKPKLSQKEIEVMGASSRLFQRFVTVQGLKESSGIDFAIHAKPASAVLNAAASPTTPYLGVLLKAILGGEYNAAGSAVVGAGSTTTNVDVTGGHGLRFRIGTIVAIGVANVLHYRVITAIATDTLTVWPALPAIPAAAQFVYNSYSYFFTETNSQSLTVDHTFTVPAAGAATAQNRFVGCTGDVQFSCARNELAQFAFSLKSADWTGASTLSIPTTVSAETMGTPIPVTNAVVYFQPLATTTDTPETVSSVATTLASGNGFIENLGGVQGLAGVVKMGGRESGSIKVVLRADPARFASWLAQDLFRFFAVFPSGSGVSKRAVGMVCNQCQIVGVPQQTNVGGMSYYELELKPVLDTTGTLDTAAASPMVFSLI